MGVLDDPESVATRWLLASLLRSNRHEDQQHASGGLAIAMMPPMTRNASTRMSRAAITSFVLVSMGGRMMHKVVRQRFCDVTRRCDVDQAPRGPLARRTHLTGRRARSARCEHTARSRPLWGATRGHAGSTQMAPALEAFEEGPSRTVGPTARRRSSRRDGVGSCRPCSQAPDGGSSARVHSDAHAGESRAEFRALLLCDREGGRARGSRGRGQEEARSGR